MEEKLSDGIDGYHISNIFVVIRCKVDQALRL
jgi:hypothetical protein